MIFCKKADLSTYLGLSAQVDQAIRFLLGPDAGRLAMGRNEISGDDGVYANRFDYETQPEESLLFETHIEYADLHLLLSGRETIYIAQEESLKRLECRESEDYIGSDGAWQCACRMTPEDVLFVFPGEAHKVKCVHEAPCRVEKLVVKINMRGSC